MTAGRMAVTLATVAVIASSALASVTIWLLLTAPATIATAVNSSDTGPIARLIAAALSSLVSVLIRYL